MSNPSSLTMCTSTDDWRCHEHVRHMRLPKRSYAQRSTSSADIASSSGGRCRLAVAKQHLLQGVAPQTEPQRLEGDDLVRRNVAKVHLWAEVLDEPRLGRFRRRLPDELAHVDVMGDLVDEPCAHLPGRTKDTGCSALARLGDHLPGACVEL